MSRLFTFLKYLLCLIVFIVISHVLIHFSLETQYKDKEVRTENVGNIIIDGKMRATSRNGQVEGTLMNYSDKTLLGKALKVSMYSKNDVHLDSQYSILGEVEPGNGVKFKEEYDGVKAEYCLVELIDEKDIKEHQEKDGIHFKLETNKIIQYIEQHDKFTEPDENI